METLSLDVFKLILKELSSQDIINLTLVGPDYHHLCHRCELDILNICYPEAHHTETPWKQFIALHNNVKTYLGYDRDESINWFYAPEIRHVLTGKILSTDIHTYENLQEHFPEDSGTEGLIILDGTLPQNCILWYLMVTQDEDESTTYNSREELAQDRSKSRYEHYLDILMDNYEDRSQGKDQENFNFPLKNRMSDGPEDINIRKLHPREVDLLTDDQYERYLKNRVSTAEFMTLTRNHQFHNNFKMPEELIPFTRENFYQCHMTFCYIDNFWNDEGVLIYKIIFNEEFSKGKMETNPGDKIFEGCKRDE